MKKTLLWVCTLIIVLGAALTVYAAPAPVEASSPYTSELCKADNVEYVAKSTVVVTPYFPETVPGHRCAYVGTRGTIKPKFSTIDDVPPGYMGINPILFLNNEVLFSAGWRYNTGSSPELTQYHETCFTTVFTPGLHDEIVSSQSDFQLYNGNGYDSYCTAMSPNLDIEAVVDDAAPIADEAARETDVTDVEDKPLDPKDFFEVNELGLTYGYAIYDDVRPDLVAAIGTGGVHGYVYMEELLSVGTKRFPDDIVTDIPASIPLYASDGVTVIGEFPIGPRTDDSSDWIQ